MTLLSERFPNCKGSHYGDKYLILDNDPSKSSNKKYKLQCIDCLVIFEAKPEKIFIGQKPCKCGKNYYKTPERKLERIKEVSLLKNIHPEDTEICLTSSEEKFNVICGVCNHVWQVDFNYFCNRNRGCPCCAGQKRYTDEEYIFRINSIGEYKKFRFYSKTSEDKLRQTSYVRLSCICCENIWESLLTNILSGKYSCPNCARLGFNPLRISHLYLLKISRDDEIIAYKYGITNNFKRRLENLRIYNKDLQISLVGMWGYSDGLICRKHENNLSVRFSKYLSKQDMPDGYTETINPSEVYDLFMFQNNQYKEYHGGVQSGGSRTNPFGS